MLFVGCCPLAAGCILWCGVGWTMDVGYRWLAVGCWLLVICCMLSDAGVDC